MPATVVFQLEIMDPLLELVRRSDVTAHLAIAVEEVREHFSLEKRPVRVEVRHDEQGELEGIGFFDPAHGDLLAHVTPFYLEREGLEQVPPAVLEAVRSQRTLREKLQELFS